MDSDELRVTLRSLHETLARSPSIDAESTQLLRTLLRDIEGLLQQPGVARTAPVHVGRLEEFASRFDADHPALSGLLRQVVDVLGKAGI
jgi:hypothetical protein